MSNHHNRSDESIRFVKVSLIKENVNSVIEWFQEEGWERLKTEDNYKGYLKQLRALEANSGVFLQDFHVPEVLSFPPGTELQYHKLYLNGSIFFMDKASCLAPLLLSPQPGSHVLDMCAAPGLKTIQLASYASSGKVYAVEKDEKRYDSLVKMVEQSGADNVTTVLQDVLTLDVDQYKHIEYILVDPSCTGSGVRLRQPSANLKARLDEKTRLEKLAGFQITLLRFALTKFPSAKRIVYSTCSLNVEENEKVVEDVLRSCDHSFDVVSVEEKLPEWLNFGSEEFQFGSKSVYCRPEVDQTNGFFITVFERKENKGANSAYKNKNLVNQFKGEKRSYEHFSNYIDSGFKVHSPKKIKEEYSNRRINKEDIEDNTDTLNPGKTKKVKLNGKNISLSEKKRSRRKMMKIKKNILPPKNKNKDTDVKLTNSKSVDAVETLKKINSNGNSNERVPNFSSESSTKISRAKLRHKRAKKMKLSVTSEVNSSSNTNCSKLATNGKVNSNSEEDGTKPNKQKHKDKMKAGASDISNEAELPKILHEKKKKYSLENNDSSFSNKICIEKEKPQRKRKNKHSFDSSAEEQKAENNENEEKEQHKKKLKKSHPIISNSITTKECDAENNGNEEKETHKKKLKRKHSVNEDESFTVDQAQNNSIVNVCLGIASNQAAEDHTVGVESTEDKTHRKKKHNLVNTSSATKESYDADYHDLGNKNREDNAHRKKNKKKHNLANTSNATEESFDAYDNNVGDEDREDNAHRKKNKKKHNLVNTSNATEESFDADDHYVGDEGREDDAHRKKNKKKHNLVNTSNATEESFDADDNNVGDESREDDAHRKKNKKKHNLVNTSNATEESFDADDNNVGDESREDDAHRKKNKKKHNLVNTSSVIEESFDADDHYVGEKGREDDAHRKKNKKKHNLVNTSNATEERYDADDNNVGDESREDNAHRKKNKKKHNLVNTSSVIEESFDADDHYVGDEGREDNAHRKKNKKKHNLVNTSNATEESFDADDHYVGDEGREDNAHRKKNKKKHNLVNTSNATEESFDADDHYVGDEGREDNAHRKKNKKKHNLVNTSNATEESFDADDHYVGDEGREDDAHRKKNKKKPNLVNNSNLTEE